MPLEMISMASMIHGIHQWFQQPTQSYFITNPTNKHEIVFTTDCGILRDAAENNEGIPNSKR